MSLFEELRQTSQDSFHYTPPLWNKSWDVWHNSLKSGMSKNFALFSKWTKWLQIGAEKKTPLFEELGQTSQDLFHYTPALEQILKRLA